MNDKPTPNCAVCRWLHAPAVVVPIGTDVTQDQIDASDPQCAAQGYRLTEGVYGTPECRGVFEALSREVPIVWNDGLTLSGDRIIKEGDPDANWKCPACKGWCSTTDERCRHCGYIRRLSDMPETVGEEEHGDHDLP